MGPPPRTMPWFFSRQVGRHGILTGPHVYSNEFGICLKTRYKCTCSRTPNTPLGSNMFPTGPTSMSVGPWLGQRHSQHGPVNTLPCTTTWQALSWDSATIFSTAIRTIHKQHEGINHNSPPLQVTRPSVPPAGPSRRRWP